MNVAFIPVRGGSKSIPLKNIKNIGGKPLVYWTVNAACSCPYIDHVYVSTDSQIIRDTVESFKTENPLLYNKVIVINRSAETASDTASTESAMLEFASNYDFDNIVLIQATSPLLTPMDLNNGFEIFNSADTDSVISAVKQKRFNWNIDSSGFAHSLNYDVFKRPRRQDFEGYWVENGAFYITTKKALMTSQNRISGRIKIAEMCEESFFEIDEPSDWVIIEALLKKKNCLSNKDLSHIKVMLTDCDGCLTDGGMYYAESGDELKKFNTKDGMGISLLHNEGILTGLVTGEGISLNEKRVQKLKMDFYAPSCMDKLKYVKELCDNNGLTLDEIAYIGDDINDLPLLEAVGFSCCPADAIDSVKSIVDYISPYDGGDGVIRDVAEFILHNRKL